MTLYDSSIDEMLTNFYSDLKKLIDRRNAASDTERVIYDQAYNRLIGYLPLIEKARMRREECLLGLTKTAGRIIQEFFKQYPS